MATTAAVNAVLESFFEDQEEFAQAVVDAGKLVDHGGYYEIFLFEDGYKLRNQNYHGPRTGIIIGIPTMSDEDYRDLIEAAGSSNDEALVKELCGYSDWLLDNIAEQMRSALSEDEGE